MADRPAEPIAPDMRRFLPIRNADTEPIPPGGACRVTGVASDGVLTVARPDTDGQTDVLFNGRMPVAVGGTGRATMTWPAVAACDADPLDGEGPSHGDTWGVESGSWALQAAQGGFLVLGDGTGGLCNVVPLPGAGTVTGTTDHVGTTDNYDGDSEINLDGTAVNIIDNSIWTLSPSKILQFLLGSSAQFIFQGGDLVIKSRTTMCAPLKWCSLDYTVGAATSLDDLVLPVGADAQTRIVIRYIDADGDFDITGIVPTFAGQVLLHVNATGQKMTFQHQDASSAAGNRFRTPGAVPAPVVTEGVALSWQDPETTGTGAGWRLACCGCDCVLTDHVVELDSGSGTWTVPDWVPVGTSAIVECWGGGGGGGGSAIYGGGGGGGGGYARATITVAAGEEYAWQAGAGGAGEVGAGGGGDVNADAGGYTQFRIPASTVLCKAFGGTGGGNYTNPSGGGGGAGDTGDVLFDGGSGAGGVSPLLGGGGGSSAGIESDGIDATDDTGALAVAGGGAGGDGGQAAGQDGAFPGGGGGGQAGGVSDTGGNGGGGLIRVIVNPSAATIGLIGDVKTTRIGGYDRATIQPEAVGTSKLADGAVTLPKLAGVSANVLLGNDASGTAVEEIPCTSAGRALLDDADAAAQRTTLGLGTAATHDHTDYDAAGTAAAAQAAAIAASQPLDSDLTAIAALTTDSFGRGLLEKATAGDVRTYIGATGTGDVIGPVSATDGSLARFDGTTGKLLKDGAAPDGSTLEISGSTLRVKDGGITLAKQADMATASVVYRKTAGTGAPEVQTLATLKTDLGSMPADITGLTAAEVALADELPEYNQAATANRKITAQKLLGLLRTEPGGRLTLTSGSPVTSADVTGSTLYYCPFQHDIIHLWDGTRWLPTQFAETSLALGTLAKEQAYDVFGYLSGGALALELCEWANATVTMTIATPCVVTWTAHGLSQFATVTFTTTGALPTGLAVDTVYYVIPSTANTFTLATSLTNCVTGTAVATSGSQSGTHTIHAPYARQTAITLQDGRYCKSGNKTRLHLGTIITTTTTLTEDSLLNRYVQNRYHKRRRKLFTCPGYSNGNTATIYSLSSTTYGPLNAGTGAAVNYIASDEDTSEFRFSAFAIAQGGAGTNCNIGIGDNSAISPIAVQIGQDGANSTYETMSGSVSVLPNVGKRFACMLGVQGGGSSSNVYADTSRAGSVADPYVTYLEGSVMG